MAVAKYVIPAVLVRLIMSGAAAVSAVQRAAPKPTSKAGSPAAAPNAKVQHLPGYNPDRSAYFGDLHVHTYLSNDAYISNVRRTPDDAYRCFMRTEMDYLVLGDYVFAKGEQPVWREEKNWREEFQLD